MQGLWILIPKHGGMELHQPLALGLQQPMGMGAVAHPRSRIWPGVMAVDG